MIWNRGKKNLKKSFSKSVNRCRRRHRRSRRRWTSRLAQKKCDQNGRFITLWVTFQSLWQQLFCPKGLHIFGIFENLSKSFILLAKSFLGNFYRHLATFCWSHWWRWWWFCTKIPFPGKRLRREYFFKRSNLCVLKLKIRFYITSFNLCLFILSLKIHG